MASAGVSEVISQIADGVLAVPPTAFGALGALGLIGAALFVVDPEKRYMSIQLIMAVNSCDRAALSCSSRPA